MTVGRGKSGNREGNASLADADDRYVLKIGEFER